MLSSFGKQSSSALLRQAAATTPPLAYVPAVTRAVAVVPFPNRNYGTTKRSEASNNHQLAHRLQDHPLFRPTRGFDDFFSPFLRDPFFNDPVPVLRRPTFLTSNLEGGNRDFPTLSKLFRSSPGYEIHETDGEYQIQVDVPGCKVEDLKVEVEGDDHAVLKITGGRKMVDKETGAETVTRFEKMFSVGTNVNKDDLEASLEDGVLTLKARKIEQKQLEPPTRSVPITARSIKDRPAIGENVEHVVDRELTHAEEAEAEEVALEDEKQRSSEAA